MLHPMKINVNQYYPAYNKAIQSTLGLGYKSTIMYYDNEKGLAGYLTGISLQYNIVLLIFYR